MRDVTAEPVIAWPLPGDDAGRIVIGGGGKCPVTRPPLEGGKSTASGGKAATPGGEPGPSNTPAAAAVAAATPPASPLLTGNLSDSDLKQKMPFCDAALSNSPRTTPKATRWMTSES